MTNDDGCQSIAIDLLNDSGDLQIYTSLFAFLSTFTFDMDIKGMVSS